MKFLDGEAIAVTGASGFCGSAVARAAAAAGARVVCVGRRPGPVGEHRPWDAAVGVPVLDDVDLVVHLAAAVGDPRSGRRTEERFQAVNVDGGARLLAAAAGKPVIWVSSSSVYDPRVDRSHVTERHPLGGQLNAYARTKAAGDLLAQQAGAVVLRPHAVYGVGDRHLLPRLRKAVRGSVALLPGPDVTISITAVGNLVSACLQAASWPAGAYNIADTEAVSRDALVTEVLAALGRPVRVAHVPLPAARAFAAVASRLPVGEPLLTPYSLDQVTHDVVLDTTRAQQQGWRAEHTLADFLTALREGSETV